MRQIDSPARLRVRRRVPPQAFVVCDRGGNRRGRIGVVGRKILNCHAADAKGSYAIRRQRRVRRLRDAGIVDCSIGERYEPVRDLVVGHDDAQLREALCRGQDAGERRWGLHHPVPTVHAAARQISWKRIGLGRTAAHAGERTASKEILPVKSGCLMQHDELDRAVGIGENLLDLVGVERGPGCGSSHSPYQSENPTERELHAVLPAGPPAALRRN